MMMILTTVARRGGLKIIIKPPKNAGNDVLQITVTLANTGKEYAVGNFTKLT